MSQREVERFHGIFAKRIERDPRNHEQEPVTSLWVGMKDVSTRQVVERRVEEMEATLLQGDFGG